MSNLHKVFVTYHHGPDESYKRLFELRFGNKFGAIIPGSVQVGDINPNLSTETIRQKSATSTRDEYLRDTSVSVVLVGALTCQWNGDGAAVRRAGRMAGRNLYPRGRTTNERLADGRPHPCVFISHNKVDKDFARAVANALMGLDVNVYFDEFDQGLGTAVDEGDHVGIARSIEAGLERSTHLLGLLSPDTFRSWWVPYEIGGAQGRRHDVAHVVHFRVQDLPSYVCLAEVIRNRSEFRSWVARLRTLTLTERTMKTASLGKLDGYIFPN